MKILHILNICEISKKLFMYSIFVSESNKAKKRGEMKNKNRGIMDN